MLKNGIGKGIDYNGLKSFIIAAEANRASETNAKKKVPMGTTISTIRDNHDKTPAISENNLELAGTLSQQRIWQFR